MIDGMPRPRPPHLQRRVTRHGRISWYVRLGRGPLVRIRAPFGTPEFDREYNAALAGQHPARPGASAGTVAWLIDRYRETPAWLSLSVATRRQRENIFRQVVKTAGRHAYAEISSATIAAGRDRRGATPFQARHFLDTMRGLFSWAYEAQLVKVNPALGVKRPPKPKTDGFPAWTEADVEQYESRWRVGTRERVWLAVLLYTGLRRGDAVRLGRQHVRDNVVTLKTAKTGIEVHIPLLPPLVEALRAGPVGDLSFICGERGAPMTKESFGNAFRDACRAAGISKSAHGVRKIGATRAANGGATVAQLEAIFGWTGGRMASHYTQSADRRRLAREAITLLNETGKSMLPPEQKVVAGNEKK